MKNNFTEGAILKAQLDFNLGKKFTYIELAWGFKASDHGHGPGFWNLFPFKKQNLNERKHSAFILQGNWPQNTNYSLVENPFCISYVIG